MKEEPLKDILEDLQAWINSHKQVANPKTICSVLLLLGATLAFEYALSIEIAQKTIDTAVKFALEAHKKYKDLSNE